jgi:tetratricopeptide (TPR) repeat protein
VNPKVRSDDGNPSLALDQSSEARSSVRIPKTQRTSVLPGWLGEAYAAAGCRDEALKVLDQLFELSKQRYVTPYGVARIHATLGNKEEALHWLDAAYRQRAEWMVLLKVDPCLDDLRPDPRFQDLMRRMNFPT